MGLADDVRAGIDAVLAPEWVSRDGTVVPETADIALKNGAVRLDATYLYADMADSTGLAQGYKDWAAAKVFVATSTPQHESSVTVAGRFAALTATVSWASLLATPRTRMPQKLR